MESSGDSPLETRVSQQTVQHIRRIKLLSGLTLAMSLAAFGMSYAIHRLAEQRQARMLYEFVSHYRQGQMRFSADSPAPGGIGAATVSVVDSPGGLRIDLDYGADPDRTHTHATFFDYNADGVGSGDWYGRMQEMSDVNLSVISRVPIECMTWTERRKYRRDYANVVERMIDSIIASPTQEKPKGTEV